MQVSNDFLLSVEELYEMMDILGHIKGGVNKSFTGKEPWQIVTITTSSVLVTLWFYDFLFSHNDSKNNLA